MLPCLRPHKLPGAAKISHAFNAVTMLVTSTRDHYFYQKYYFTSRFMSSNVITVVTIIATTIVLLQPPISPTLETKKAVAVNFTA